MKKEQGVTLISLIVYVILMTFIIALISKVTTAFYVNINDFDSDSESAVAYAKFNMYFINDIKRRNTTIDAYSDNYIILSYGAETTQEIDDEVITTETTKIEYSVQNNILYRNKVKICSNVKDVQITANTDNNTIVINMIIGGYNKKTTYVVEGMLGSTDEETQEIL